ncbi:uncharacterized protein [Montipora foliosa]|uniref:uncharacterized protein n=1 Tax=Montipora foliosa TaxID=591990 RepID=UPI0035F17911
MVHLDMCVLYRGWYQCMMEFCKEMRSLHQGSERCPRPDKVRPQHQGLRPLLLSNINGPKDWKKQRLKQHLLGDFSATSDDVMLLHKENAPASTPKKKKPTDD